MWYAAARKRERQHRDYRNQHQEFFDSHTWLKHFTFTPTTFPGWICDDVLARMRRPYRMSTVTTVRHIRYAFYTMRIAMVDGLGVSLSSLPRAASGTRARTRTVGIPVHVSMWRTWLWRTRRVRVRAQPCLLTRRATGFRHRLQRRLQAWRRRRIAWGGLPRRALRALTVRVRRPSSALPSYGSG